MKLEISDSLYATIVGVFREMERGCTEVGISPDRWKSVRKQLQKAMMDAVQAECVALAASEELPCLLRRQAN
jgi:hypothetical protein